MRALYVFLSYITFFLVSPLLLLSRKTRMGWKERLGFYPKELFLEKMEGCIWFHGASAGDLLSLLPMVKLMRKQCPDRKIVLSTLTNSGRFMAHSRLEKHVDAIVFAPWDIECAVRRAIRHISPELLVLEYTEMWPNLIWEAKAHGAKIALTNGRFSKERLSAYRLLLALSGISLSAFDALMMREKEGLKRARLLGARPEATVVTGSTKFDVLADTGSEEELEALRCAFGFPAGARILVAGSTHEGEEELLLDVFLRLRSKFQTLRLVLAPRYIDRVDRVCDLASQHKLKVKRRSRAVSGEVDVVVLDTMGELSKAYQLSEVVFVGGSFVSRGGQNILEPAAQGRAVLFGPHMKNFEDCVAVLVGRGGVQVNSKENLENVLSKLLAQSDELRQLGKMAKAAVEQVSGASERNVYFLRECLKTHGD
ncbi:MAG: 3-deoxy-D-manno-octulosonic acid transferase [Cystobacterineae bacterium]|nr:3-deoxy-D-manno-octulosonic acid transferase [Cystobacterineae bacterium]